MILVNPVVDIYHRKTAIELCSTLEESMFQIAQSERYSSRDSWDELSIDDHLGICGYADVSIFPKYEKKLLVQVGATLYAGKIAIVAPDFMRSLGMFFRHDKLVLVPDDSVNSFISALRGIWARTEFN